MIREINPINLEFKKSLEYNNIRGYAMSLEFGGLNKIIKTNAKFSVGDRNTSIIAIQLLNNGSPIILEEYTLIYANVERPDGTLVANKCKILEGDIGAILISLNALTMEYSGTLTMDITLRYNNKKKLVSPKLSFNLYDSNDVHYVEPDDSEVNVLDILVDEVVTLKESVIKANNVIIQDSEERKAIEAEYDLKEAERRLAETERHNSFNSMAISFNRMEEAELIRVEQENQRQQYIENISQEFSNKMSTAENKLTLLDMKMTEFTNNEETRQDQHLQRKDEFDNVIKVDHRNMVQAEELRKSSENERKIFFNEFKSKETQWTTQEELREIAETNRINSHRDMVSTFDSKVQTSNEKISEISEKITEATQKISQFSNDEATRKLEHSARVNKFDNEIIVKHQEMVSAESERITFYNQAKVDETERIEADQNREQRVVTLENRVNSKISELNTANVITNSEIDTIIANALR